MCIYIYIYIIYCIYILYIYTHTITHLTNYYISIYDIDTCDPLLPPSKSKMAMAIFGGGALCVSRWPASFTRCEPSCDIPWWP